MRIVKRSVLPGFGLTMGVTVVYLSLIVLIPLAVFCLRMWGVSWSQFWEVATQDRVVSAMKLTFGGAFLAALLNAFFGFLVAWVLVRYKFPLRRLIDAMIDLPFALPTAVSGIALTALFVETGWLGQIFHLFHIKIAYTPLGVLVAMTFIGLPFVVRAVQPAIQDVEKELEEVSASLGASRWQTFYKVILPIIAPSLLTGFAMAFARALGEYGSIIFISGNKIGETEIVSKVIMSKLDQFKIEEAMIIALLMLIVSFALLLLINFMQGKLGLKTAKM